MPTDKDIQTQVIKLSEQVAKMTLVNSSLLDEVATLKRNYSRLVSEMNERLELVHEKVFRR